jgi:hypothetical protein
MQAAEPVSRGQRSMKKPAIRFETMLEVDVPKSRNSKHKGIVAAILSDLDQLKAGSAFKIPLEGLGDSKANVRSALNRATRKSGRKIATATDEEFLYVWNVK